MDFLLIGGQPDTGKTDTISRLTLRLITRYSFTIISGSISSLLGTSRSSDFSVILDGINLLGIPIKILIHSATDDKNCINQLQEEILKYSPDIVICSIRDIGWERNDVLDIVSKNFSFEVPLAKITRTTYKGHSLSWYRLNIDRVIDFVSSNTPFNL